MSSKFVYVTYIRTTPDKLWEALTTPEFTRLYFFDATFDGTWTKGSPWKMQHPDGSVSDDGEVLESTPPARLVLKWQNQFAGLKDEGPSRCTFDITPLGEQTQLTVTHEMDRNDSKVIAAVSGGWPKILSSLKSYLETGKALDTVKAAAKEREARVANG
ncbi:MAG: SRPBCC family protein [Bauldia sp.]